MGKHRSSDANDRKEVKGSSKHKHKTEKKEHMKKTLPLGDVHSANAWEEVKFESEERKEKFLRLMGAQKQRKHAGSIKIGENSVTHTRAGVGVEEMGKDLERQFTEGLEHKFLGNRHAGLGCSDEGSSPILRSRSFCVDEDKESEVQSQGGKYMMRFVKSSSDD